MEEAKLAAATAEPQKMEVEVTRYSALPLFWRTMILIFAVLGIILAIWYTFGFTFRGNALFNYTYYTLFISLFLGSAYLILPARKKDKRKIPWYDVVLAVVAFGTFLYFGINSVNMQLLGWTNVPGGIIAFFLVLEAARRTGGWIYLGVCVVLSLYPIYAHLMPGMFFGLNYTFPEMIETLIFKGEGTMGLITKILAEIVLGFLIFAGILIASGAGDFFLKLSLGLLGRYRGGPAKVAALSSGFFGSLSGSVFSNIVATGSVTIPTMKRIGYPAHYAGAIEACASTGGILMPPVMGAVAFVMAEIVGVDYAVIIASATIPAILYYFGLIMQIDAYAGRVGLRGVPRAEIPSLKQTLKDGWPFVAVLLFLLWGLLYMRWERLAPWYAAGLMFVLSFYRRETMMTPRRLFKAVVTISRLIIQATALLLPIGFIMCGLSVTGATVAFTAGIITLGMENLFLILILGVMACYLMGMAGIGTAAYVFLAVTLAPAVMRIAPEINIFAIHLFIIYYSMLAGITPPVAASAFLAATMAEAPPLKTAITAARLGVVIYIIPFFFVFNPALVLQGPPIETIYLFALAAVGIMLIAGGFEGYLVKVGKIPTWARPFLAIAGFLIGFPQWTTTIVGVILASVVLAIVLKGRGGRTEGAVVAMSP